MPLSCIGCNNIHGFLCIFSMMLTFAQVRSNAPTFNSDNDQQNVLFLPKDCKPGMVIYRFIAWDSDKQFPLSFRIESSMAREIVDIRSVSDTEANLILQRPLPQNTVQDPYEVPIVVTDTGGESTPRQFKINVTDARGSPDHVFIAYENSYTISEGAALNTVVGKVRAKGDISNRQTVSLNINESSLFTINSVLINGKDIVEGQILLQGPLDYETQTFYELQIEALNVYTEKPMDTRNIIYLPILIIVTDEQDTPPTFTEIPTVVHIGNDMKASNKVAAVRAEDGDTANKRSIQYSLLAGTDWQYFQIDSANGEIILTKSAAEISQLNRGAPIILNVKAEEMGAVPGDPLASTTQEVVVLLDSWQSVAPVFAQELYDGDVEEHAPPFSLVNIKGITQITDSDLGLAGVFTLSLEDKTPGQNVDYIFEITPSVITNEGNFQIRVKSSQLLDYESFKEIEFKIVATELAESALSSSAMVVVHIKDINDNVPVFTKDTYEVSIPEDIKEGTLIVQVSATDADSDQFGRVTYTKITGDIADKLHLDPQTGRITVATSSHGFDREKQAEHVLQVEASDSGNPPKVNTTTVKIRVLDVNDNAPQFKKGVYQVVVAPDIPLTEPFLQVEAVDADEPLTSNSMVRYEILRGNRGDMFQINPVTGELSLRKIPDLQNREGNEEQEEQSLYTLTVRAYDMGIPHLNNTVIVYVHFKTDNPGFMNGTVQYIFPGSVTDINRDKDRIERFLSKLNGASTFIERVTPYEDNYDNRIQARSVSNDRSLVTTTVRYHKRSLVDLSIVARELNGTVGLPIMEGASVSKSMRGDVLEQHESQHLDDRSVISVVSTEAGQPDHEQVVEAGVSYGWKVAMITILVIFAIVIFLLICFCFWRQFRKLDERKIEPSEDKNADRSQVIEVVTATHDQRNVRNEQYQQHQANGTENIPVGKLTQNGKTISEEDDTTAIRRNLPPNEGRYSAGPHRSRRPHVNYSRHLHGLDSQQGRDAQGNSVHVEMHSDHLRQERMLSDQGVQEVEQLDERLMASQSHRGVQRPNVGASNETYRLGNQLNDLDDEIEEIIVIEPDGTTAQGGDGGRGVPVQRVRRIIKRSPAKHVQNAFREEEEDGEEDWAPASLPEWLGRVPAEYIGDYEDEQTTMQTKGRGGRKIIVRKYKGGDGGSLPGDRLDGQWVTARGGRRHANDPLVELDRGLWNTSMQRSRVRPRHTYRGDRGRALTRASLRVEDDSEEDLIDFNGQAIDESRYIQRTGISNHSRGRREPILGKTLRFERTMQQGGNEAADEWEADIEDELDKIERRNDFNNKRSVQTTDKSVGNTDCSPETERKDGNEVRTQSRAVSARPLEDLRQTQSTESMRNDTTLSYENTATSETKDSSTPKGLTESENSPQGPDSVQSVNTSDDKTQRHLEGKAGLSYESSNASKIAGRSKPPKGKRESRYMDWYKQIERGSSKPNQTHSDAPRKRRQRVSPNNKPLDESGDNVADETKVSIRRRGSEPSTEERNTRDVSTSFGGDDKRRSETALDVIEAQMRLGGNRFSAEDDEDSGIGHTDSFKSSKKQFLEKKSLFTIAYNQNKQDALKDRDSSANGNGNRIT